MQNERVIVDLTGDTDDDSATQPVCDICNEDMKSAVTYRCCQQLCCLACYRAMHIGRGQPRTECPYCRQEARVDMDCMRINFLTSNHECGQLLVSPLDRFSHVRQLITSRSAFPYTALCLNGRRVQDTLRLIDTNIESGDLLTASY